MDPSIAADKRTLGFCMWGIVIIAYVCINRAISGLREQSSNLSMVPPWMNWLGFRVVLVVSVFIVGVFIFRPPLHITHKVYHLELNKKTVILSRGMDAEEVEKALDGQIQIAKDVASSGRREYSISDRSGKRCLLIFHGRKLYGVEVAHEW
jgi:hypothetical protein